MSTMALPNPQTAKSRMRGSSFQEMNQPATPPSPAAINALFGLQREIRRQFPPNAVDVVGRVARPIGLHVQELTQERRALDLISVTLPRFRAAAVAEVDLVDARVL